MNVKERMTAVRIIPLAFVAAALLSGGAARCQDAAPPGSPASLLDALSLISGGMLPLPGVAPVVTQDNGTSHVAFPLHGLASPPDAAVTVTATADADGVWDITGLTLPDAGTIDIKGPPAGTLRYTIAHQAAQARIDPTLRTPSPFAWALDNIVMHVSGQAPSDVTMGEVTSAGTLTGSGGGRVTQASRVTVQNLVVSKPARGGEAETFTLRGMGVQYDFRDLDLARARRLTQVTRAIAAEPRPAPAAPGQRPDDAARMRQVLDAYIDAAADGMLSGLTIEDTLNGLHLLSQDGRANDIATLRIGLRGAATGDGVSGSIDLGANDIALAGAPPAYAPYIPSGIALRSAFSGIEAEALRHWLHDTTRGNADPATLRAEAVALLNRPGAKAGIEALQMTIGPMRIEGSADMRPTPDGSPAYDIHLTATGVDGLLSQVQSDPNARQILPMLFLAKGFGRQEGDRLVWDIHFAHGMVTVNGVSLPLGLPNAKKPR